MGGVERIVRRRSREVGYFQQGGRVRFCHHSCDGKVAVVRWFCADGGEVCLDGLPGLIAIVGMSVLSPFYIPEM